MCVYIYIYIYIYTHIYIYIYIYMAGLVPSGPVEAPGLWLRRGGASGTRFRATPARRMCVSSSMSALCLFLLTCLVQLLFCCLLSLDFFSVFFCVMFVIYDYFLVYVIFTPAHRTLGNVHDLPPSPSPFLSHPLQKLSLSLSCSLLLCVYIYIYVYIPVHVCTYVYTHGYHSGIISSSNIIQNFAKSS